MSNLVISPTTSKDALSILGASDDRELISQGLDDFLPYDFEYQAVVEIIESKAQKNHDNRGVFVKMKVIESTDAKQLPVGKQFTLAFFDQHKTLPEFVISKMVQSRREYAAAIAGEPCNDQFQAAPVLLQLHNEVEPLGIRMRLHNEYQRTTRAGKKIHELKFELAQ
jgi:hypothetical protein